MMYYGYGHNGGWLWVFGALMIVGMIALVGLAGWAIQLVRQHTQAAAMTQGDGSATAASRAKVRQILDERYARGEISSDDYAERLRTLGW